MDMNLVVHIENAVNNRLHISEGKPAQANRSSAIGEVPPFVVFGEVFPVFTDISVTGEHAALIDGYVPAIRLKVYVMLQMLGY